MIKKIRNHLQILKTTQELEMMSNRELNDIGLTRGDIPRVARALTAK